jgi:DNA-binding transcriptional ArsR family regulator
LPDIARIAYLLSDPARARIVWTLIDGTTRPAGELAYAANISAQSASAHLAKLVRGGLLDAEAHGRHRYFRLASADVASTVEGMASLAAGTRPRRPRPAAAPPGEPQQFLYARTCYGHLAGEIAVASLEGMLKRKWLTARGQDFTVSPAGEKELQRWASTSHLRIGRDAYSRGPVSISRSAGPISAGRSAKRCSTPTSGTAGCSVIAARVSSASRRTGIRVCDDCSA